MARISFANNMTRPFCQEVARTIVPARGKSGGDAGRAGRAPTDRSNNPRIRGRSAQAARNREARVEATSVLTNQSATLAGVFSVLALSLFSDLSDLADLSDLVEPSALSLELLGRLSVMYQPEPLNTTPTG